jgi:hypothetical protein
MQFTLLHPISLTSILIRQGLDLATSLFPLASLPKLRMYSAPSPSMLNALPSFQYEFQINIVSVSEMSTIIILLFPIIYKIIFHTNRNHLHEIQVANRM